MKICIVGCGLRTPLLLYGLVHSTLPIDEVALYDTESARAQLMTEIGKQIANGALVRIRAHSVPDKALDGCDFVISSFRAGNMETRAADERLALECGFAGQETTGPAGFAMALRTVPTALRYARIVERVAPSAWIVNFTNPAGIITQAISGHTQAKVIGICDTPSELIFQIARALGEPRANVRCDYFGLNHLGWVRSVCVRGEEVIGRFFEDAGLLGRLYPTELFSTDFISALALIPTEYVFFYYNQQVAVRNQLSAGATRGEELDLMNRSIWTELNTRVRAGDPSGALDAYRLYLNRRNSSYMRLEAAGQSAFEGPDPDWDPFEGETGYHRIAVESINALTSSTPRALILNVPNQGAIEAIAADDIVEVPCLVDESGPRPMAVGKIPDSVRGLMIAVKYFEQLTIEAAVAGSWDKAVFALAMNPIVGSWEPARHFLERLAVADQGHFKDFGARSILQPTAVNP